MNGHVPRAQLFGLLFTTWLGILGCGESKPPAPVGPPTEADVRPLLEAALAGKLVATGIASAEIKAMSKSGPDDTCNVPAGLASFQFTEPPGLRTHPGEYYAIRFKCDQILEDHAYDKRRYGKLHERVTFDRKAFDEAGAKLNRVPDPTSEWLYARSLAIAERKSANVTLAKGAAFPLTGSGKMRVVDGQWKFQYDHIEPVKLESNLATAGELPGDVVAIESASEQALQQPYRDYVADVQASLEANQGRPPAEMSLAAAYAYVWQARYTAAEVLAAAGRKVDSAETAQVFVTKLREQAALVRKATERFEKLPPPTPEVDGKVGKYFRMDHAPPADLGPRLLAHLASPAERDAYLQASEDYKHALQGYTAVIDRKLKQK